MATNAEIAKTIEEAANKLYIIANTLHRDADAVKKGRKHRARESISTICNIMQNCGLNSIIFAVTEDHND